MNMLNFVDKIDEIIEPFKKFIDKNYGNPLMWFGFILLGLLIFSIVFGALHRNGD